MKIRSQKNRAFTLVELLFSLGLVILVLSILYFVISSGSRQGKKLYQGQVVQQTADRCMAVLRRDLRSTLRMQTRTQELALEIITQNSTGSPVQESAVWTWTSKTVQRVDPKGIRKFNFDLNQNQSLHVKFGSLQAKIFSASLGIKSQGGPFRRLSQEKIFLESLE
jgi:type II secretory pathway pseudopilin PulG